jgi:hypothetical protein
LASEVDQFKQGEVEWASEVERLKQQVERLTNTGELLASEVEGLKQLVTPRLSFMPTGNRTMPGWGNSAYTRCQLPFLWTELIKVLRFLRYYPIFCFIQLASWMILICLQS